MMQDFTRFASSAIIAGPVLPVASALSGAEHGFAQTENPQEDSVTAEITPEALMLQAFERGDPDAAECLISEHQTSAFWVAYHILRDEDIARDMVQEAFLKVLRKPSSYDPQRPFKAWFLRIVHNLAVDWLRRSRPHANSEQMDQTAAPVSRDRLEGQELQERVALILRLLPEKYRSLLIMRDVEGLEPTAMARAEGIEAGAMRFRIHYARKAFRKLWSEHFGDDRQQWEVSHGS